MSVSIEDFRTVLNALYRYDYITQRTGYEWRGGLHANLDHSSLLQRLVFGGQIYKFPPPRAMSYPYYSLLDNGKDDACLVSIYKAFDGSGTLKVNFQQGEWDLEEDLGAKCYIASWPDYLLRVRLDHYVRRGTKEQGFAQEFEWDYWRATVLETENTPVAHDWEIADVRAKDPALDNKAP